MVVFNAHNLLKRTPTANKLVTSYVVNISLPIVSIAIYKHSDHTGRVAAMQSTTSSERPGRGR